MWLDLLFAQKVIIVTVILENMARLLGEENIEDEDIADNGDLNDVVEDNALDGPRDQFGLSLFIQFIQLTRLTQFIHFIHCRSSFSVFM